MKHEQNIDTPGGQVVNVDAVVMPLLDGRFVKHLSPYVAPEHRELLAEAERQLTEYSERLAKQLLSPREPLPGASILPRWGQKEAMEAQRAFYNDPFRNWLINELCRIKMLVERPRFLVMRKFYSIF